MAEENLDAVDVLNWEYLVKIATFFEEWEVKHLHQAIRTFAYGFTSTDSVEKQNSLLACWLENATHLQSAETAEEIVSTLAELTCSDLQSLRRFAKQNGIRLKRG